MTSKAREYLAEIAKENQEAKGSGMAPTPGKLSVRSLLKRFGYARRGSQVVAEIRNALEDHGLRTSPDFASAWIDSEISIELDRKSESGSAAAAAPDDPTVRIDAVDAANRRPEVVDPDKPLQDAITVMLLNDYSQLPVAKNLRKIRGMITWKSIGSMMSAGVECSLVKDCMDPHVQKVPLKTPLLDAVSAIANHGYTLVEDSTDKIVGIVTASDLSREFHKLASPFLLIGEIEGYLYTLVRGRFTKEELQEALPKGLPATGTGDLTLGGYRRLLEKPANWTKLGLEYKRKLIVERLEAVRQIRNDVMHFRLDDLDPEEQQLLQGLVEFFRYRAGTGVVDTSENSS